jgi:hypothetical protein
MSIVGGAIVAEQIHCLQAIEPLFRLVVRISSGLENPNASTSRLENLLASLCILWCVSLFIVSVLNSNGS